MLWIVEVQDKQQNVEYERFKPKNVSGIQDFDKAIALMEKLLF